MDAAGELVEDFADGDGDLVVAVVEGGLGLDQAVEAGESQA